MKINSFFQMLLSYLAILLLLFKLNVTTIRKKFNFGSNKDFINMRLQEKIECVSHPVLKKLYQTMLLKSSNLAVSVDVVVPEKLIVLVEQVAEHICVLKTHMEFPLITILNIFYVLKASYCYILSEFEIFHTF